MATIANTASDVQGATLLKTAGNQTVTGLKTFNRGTSPPFAVAAGAAKVDNLDADLLDGQSTADYHNASLLDSGTLPDARFPATLPAASGINLTALNATNLGSGTVPLARNTAIVKPTVVDLTDGATVALDASLGNVFRLSAAGNRTILAPTNPTAGQKIVIRHHASGADRTLALTTGSAGAFRFGVDITSLSATTSAKKDYIGAIYDATDDRWDVVAYVKGY